MDIDLTADLNAQDDDGLGRSTLADAHDPARVRPGAMLLAGNRYSEAVVRIVAHDAVPLPACLTSWRARMATNARGGSVMSSSAAGTKDDPWILTTPPGTAEYRIHREDTTDPAELVCEVGSTKLRYLARCLDDVPAMLAGHGDWMELGSTDENKPAKDGTLESWARSDANPVGGWYGLRKGYRGRFAMYIPPLLEVLGLVELEHNPKNNRIRAK